MLWPNPRHPGTHRRQTSTEVFHKTQGWGAQHLGRHVEARAHDKIPKHVAFSLDRSGMIMAEGTIFGIVASLIFMGAMVHVLYTDLTQERIHNWVIIGLIALYLPLGFAAGFELQDLAMGFGAGLIVFMAGFGCFTMGWLDAGDVKLAAVSAMWLGPTVVFHYLLWTAILGTMITFAILALRRKRALEEGREFRRGLPLPYAPGMALAAIILFPQSGWGTF